MTTIAEIDQVATGSTKVFAGFGNVAIEGDLVVFEAVLGSVFVPSAQGIYGWRNGVLFQVIGSGDSSRDRRSSRPE